MSPMLSPLAGALLALAVIPPLILLYFLKLRRRQQAVSSTLLWLQSVEDLRANAPFQKLRKSLLLFLQLLILILLSLALAQPQLHAGRQSGGRTVILIDNSASMSSTDVTTPGLDATRLDEAKRRAKEKIEALYGGGLFASSGGQTMIVVFSDSAEIYCRFTDSKQQLLAAIDRIQPTHGETRIGEALQLAHAYTTNVVDLDTGELRPIDDPPTLELFSDGRIADVEEHVLRGKGDIYHYHIIGSPNADNVAISGISVERPYDRPGAVQVFAALMNFNYEPVTCDLQLSVDGTALVIEESRVPAARIDESTGQFIPGRANVVFSPFNQPRGAVIEVANLRRDDLMADNIAQVAVTPPRRLRVALVTPNPSQSMVRTALEGMRIIEQLVVFSPDRYEADAPQGGLDSYDVIVVDNHKLTAMPPGRYLTFGPTPPIEGLIEYGEASNQIILTGRDEHPALHYVNYQNIFIANFRLLQIAPDVMQLLEGSRSPAVVTMTRGRHHLIHCAFDPLESTWPLEQSFVQFIQNSIEYLGDIGQAITSQGLRPGEVFTTRLPANATDIRLLTPDGKTEILSVDDPTRLAWGPVRLAGPYLLTWRVPDSNELQRQAFAVNLLSETEGRLEVSPTLVFGTDPVAGRKSDERVYTPLWPWAIGLSLVVLMLEWWVYHKKAYI